MVKLIIIKKDRNEKLWCWEGDAFGDVQPQVEHVKMPLRMAGQYADEEVGLFYNYFRFYDPATGRYIENDPIDLQGGLNRYGYVNGSPLHNIDPTGEFAIALLPTISSGVIHVVGSTVSIGISVAILNKAVEQDKERQAEYIHMKTYCDKPILPGRNNCSTLSQQIEHAKTCISLYQAWDNKWLPGRHSEKIQTWKNRLNNLIEKHQKDCVGFCYYDEYERN